MNQFSRRLFLSGTIGGMLAGCSTSGVKVTQQAKKIPSLKRSGYKSPNEKLNVAGIGVGGKGSSDIAHCAEENVVALCDVDWNRAAGSFRRFPDAEQFKDFRVMLEKRQDIDAVTISTPDHTHAVIALWAMESGKHVFVQKPLTRTVNEARKLMESARRNNVATQMGNQGNSGDVLRYLCEMIWEGRIGQVREVHVWTDRAEGWWPQGIPNSLPAEPIPDHLDWDLWLGPAPMRPYNPGYAPFNWRGWWDFGTGALGDIACHACNSPNRALRLTYPTSVQCIEAVQLNTQTFPTESIIKYEFPARGNFAAVTLYWYDGKRKPQNPVGVPSNIDLVGRDNGVMYIGDDGILVHDAHAYDLVYYADGQIINDYEDPKPMIPRIPGPADDPKTGNGSDYKHKLDWLRACKGIGTACSNFDYASPFTEWVDMGVIAIRFPNQILEVDGPNMRFTNHSEANQWITQEHRQGFELI